MKPTIGEINQWMLFDWPGASLGGKDWIGSDIDCIHVKGALAIDIRAQVLRRAVKELANDH